MNARFGKIIAASALLIVSTAANATVTAGELMVRCANGDLPAGKQQASSVDQAICTITLSGFRDGFIEGTLRGALGTYIYDRKVDTAGVADVQDRIAKIVPKIRCNISVKDDDSIVALKRALISYVSAHPDKASIPYPQALSEAIDTYLCSNR